MNKKSLMWIGMAVGSSIFGLIPTLWGESFLSFTGLIFNTLGGILGIWVGYKMSTYF